MGKKRKRHSLTFPNTKLHAKNQKNLSRGFPGKQGETDTERERDRDGPEYKGPPDAIAKPSDQKFRLRRASITLKIILNKKYLYEDHVYYMNM